MTQHTKAMHRALILMQDIVDTVNTYGYDFDNQTGAGYFERLRTAVQMLQDSELEVQVEGARLVARVWSERPDLHVRLTRL